MSGDLHVPEYWLTRAKEVRAEAEAMPNPSMKKTMLKIADTYERLAPKEHAQFQAAPSPKAEGR